VKCEYVCDSGYHVESGACVEDPSYAWFVGSWSSCSQATEDRCEGYYTVETGGSCTGDGYITSAYGGGGCSNQTTRSACEAFNANIQNCCSNCSCGGSCTWSPVTSVVNCDDSDPQTESDCESQNSSCTWVEGEDSVRTRTVSCVEEGTSNVVPDSYCVPPKPETVEACVNYCAQAESSSGPLVVSDPLCVNGATYVDGSTRMSTYCTSYPGDMVSTMTWDCEYGGDLYHCAATSTWTAHCGSSPPNGGSGNGSSNPI